MGCCLLGSEIIGNNIKLIIMYNRRLALALNLVVLILEWLWFKHRAKLHIMLIVWLILACLTFLPLSAGLVPSAQAADWHRHLSMFACLPTHPTILAVPPSPLPPSPPPSPWIGDKHLVRERWLVHCLRCQVLLQWFYINSGHKRPWSRLMGRKSFNTLPLLWSWSSCPQGHF